MTSLVERGASRLSARMGAFSRVLILLCGTAGTALLALGTQFILARGLDISDYGRLAALLAVVNVVTPLASCSMGWFWLQLFGEEGRGALRWIVPTIRVSVITTTAAILLLGLYTGFSEHETFARTIAAALMLTPVLVGQSLAETTSARLQLEERYVLFAAWQALTQLGRLLVVLTAFATSRHGMDFVLSGYAIVGGLIALISAFSVDEVRRGRIDLAGHDGQATSCPDLEVPPLWTIFQNAMPYGLITIFYLLFSQAIVAFVGIILGHESAAMYNVAFLIVAAIYLIPNVIYTKYLVSKIFRWWVHDRQMFNAVFHLGVISQLTLGVVLMILVMASAHWVMPLLFGQRYVRAVPLLLILAVGIPIRFVGHTYGSAFFSKENVPRKIRYMGVAAGVAIALSLVLLPLLGVMGAAISAVSAELTLLVLYVQGAARHVGGIDVTSTFRPETIRSSLALVSAASATP